MEKSLAFALEFCLTLRTLKQEEVYLWDYKIFSDVAKEFLTLLLNIIRRSCFVMKKSILIICALFFLLPTFVFSEGIDWEKPVSMYERVTSPTYVLPEGWEEAIGETKEISFMNSGPLKWDPGMVKGIEVFEKLTGLKVNAIEIGDELLHTKQSAMLRAKSPKLDLVFTTLSQEAYHDYQAAGWLEPCDFLVNDEIKGLYSEDIIKVMEIDGKIYGFPYIGGGDIYAYRKDLFEKHGLSEPESWEDIVEIGQKLKTDDMWGFAFPARSGFESYWFWCAFLVSAGGDLIHDGKVVVNTPEGIEALQFMTDLRNKYKVVPEGVNTYGINEMGDLFAAGKIASFISFSYTYQRVMDTKEMYDNFVMTLFPAKDKNIEQKSHMNTSFYSVSPFSKNKAAASLFLDFLRSYEERKYELLIERNTIFNIKVWQDPEIKEEKVPFISTLRRCAERGKIFGYQNAIKIVDLVSTGVSKALIGEMSAKEALDEVQEKIDVIQTW
jgi:ABC-type glycerol-3-phosphate transport system substrate-binding protein